MTTGDLWHPAWEALQALGAHYGPAIDHAAEGIGIPLGEWYGWLMAADLRALSSLRSAAADSGGIRCSGQL